MQKKNNRQLSPLLIMLTALLLVTGCKTVPVYKKPVSLQLPSTFHGNTDSTSMGDKPWNEFFTDAYLRSLIDTALHNNWDLQAALQRIEIARANYTQTRGALLPVVNGQVNASLNRYSANTDKDVKSLPGNPTTEFFIGLQSSWEIDIWHKLKNRRQAALQRFFSSREAARLVRTVLVAEVAKRYFDLLTLDKQLAIVKKNIELQKSALDVIVIQKEAGRATQLAVQQFQAQLLNTESLEIQYAQQIYETENELNTLLGRLPQFIPRSDSMSLTTAFAAEKPGVPSSLLFRRPDIAQAEKELKAFESDIESARAMFLPSLTITPFVGFNSFKAVNMFDPASVVFGLAGGLTAPLFNRLAISSNYQRAEAAGKMAFYNYQKTIVTSYAEVATNLGRITNFRKLYDLKKQQTKALQDAVSTSKDLYLAGYASYLEVILAQGNVLEAELNMATSGNQLNQAYIDLYRSLGGG